MEIITETGKNELSVCDIEEAVDELKVCGYLISCIGCSLMHEHMPSEEIIVSLTCADIAERIDKVSNILANAAGLNYEIE